MSRRLRKTASLSLDVSSGVVETIVRLQRIIENHPFGYPQSGCGVTSQIYYKRYL